MCTMLGEKVGALVLVLLLLLFMHVTSESESSDALMERSEQEALYDVIQGFVGMDWNGSGLYPDPCGWTPMQGVSCDIFNGLWYITVINIGSILDNSLQCNLDATFKPKLFDFKHLRALTFFNCFSSSYKPMTITSHMWGNLAKSLEILEFRSNQGLIGGIPASFGRLVNLRSLVLVDNALTGEIPLELGKLNHLRRLALGGNRLSGQIPPSLVYNLSELLILDLSGNSLTGHMPSSLGSMSSLLKLDLSNNLLEGKLPEEMGKLRNLTLLDVRNNNFTGGLARSLQDMSSLEDLLLSSNPLGGTMEDFDWKKLRNLVTLDLSNTGLIGSIPLPITKMIRLRYISLENNQLTGEVPIGLSELPSLTALYLNGNNLSGVLRFSSEFYERVGRKFSAGNNTDLCCIAGMVPPPLGVEQCKKGQDGGSVYVSDSNKVGSWSPDENSCLTCSCLKDVVMLVLVLILVMMLWV